MLLSHSSWLCIILPTLIAATPQRTAPARPKRSLAPQLQQHVPACAQPCLRSSLSEQFPLACTTTVDLGCLCSRYSFNGQSLGEVALGCIYASCSTYHGAASAYNICLGERDAVIPTLTALTVVATTSPMSMSMSSSRPVVITTTYPSSAATPTPRSRASLGNTVNVDSVSSIPPPTSTASEKTTSSLRTTTPRGSATPQETATPPAAADPSRKMSPAQIAGLSVAVGAAFVIAIGLMGLVIFLRRRRERKNNPEENEKGRPSSGLSDYSPDTSQPFNPNPSASDLPNRFLSPSPSLAAQRSPGRNIKIQQGENAGLRPLKLGTARKLNASSEQLNAPYITDRNAIHPLLRPEQEFSNNTSNSSVPLEQIGLAITVEPPRQLISQGQQKAQPPNEEVKQHRQGVMRHNADISRRPDSVMTETTLFEEDGARRESKLLPALPVPIPPIRTLQPPRTLPAASSTVHTVGKITDKQLPQQPELCLDIPVRYLKSQPSKIDAADALSRENPKPIPAPKARLPPQASEYNPTSASSELSTQWDIPDYYFTAYEEPRPIHSVSPSHPSRRFRPKLEQAFGNLKPKRSSSNVSRATSRASTNIRDSFSSQTSFETVDANDPTPEDDGDKRLDVRRLSPVAESPIHKLRYPKVPRTSNQLVPRSPKSPQSQASQGSQPPSLFAKRKGDQAMLTLGSPFSTASEIRKYRQHLRSSSVDTFSPTRTSERSTRTQSSLWPKSPAMFAPDDAVRPLSIRKTQLLQTPNEDMQALKSPDWVPRLTPTRQGNDLFINVTYSKPGQ